MFIDTVLYALIGAYIQAVLPTQEFGVPRPWYFPVTDAVALVRSLLALCTGGGRKDGGSGGKALQLGETPAVVQPRRRRQQAPRPSLFSWQGLLSLVGLGSGGAGSYDASLLSGDDADEAAAEARRFFQPLDSSLQAKLREGRCVSVRGLRKEFATDKGEEARAGAVLTACAYSALRRSPQASRSPSTASTLTCSRVRCL